VTWATTGARTVSVSYTNTNNCTAASPTVYNVTVNALPTPTITGPVAACVNSTGNVYTTQAGMTNYAWAVSAGGTITAGGTSTSNTVTVTWNTSGAQTVSVNYTNTNNCSAASPTVYNVTVNTLPVPIITGSSSVCTASTGNVYSTTAGMTNYAWVVSAGGSITAGGTATSNTVTVTWNTSGAQTVSVNYTNANSCTAASPTVYNVTVNPLPVPIITGPTSVCAASTGNIYSTTAGMTNYAWVVSVGGTITAGGTATSNTVTVTWNTSGAQTVSVNYTNANSCTAASPTVYNVTVNALPTPTITGPAAACVNSTGNVYTTQTGMTNYIWTVSTGGTITAGGGTGNNTVIVTWTTAGARTVSVSYTNTNNCTAASPTVYNVTVNALPVPVITGSATVCAGSTGNVYSTTAGMTNYAWLVSAGGTITAGGGTGNSSVTVTWNTPGAQTVSVNYTNTNGCTAASPTVYNVTVNALPTITGTTPASRCGTGTVTLAATASAGTINWYSTFTGGTSDGTGTTFLTPGITSTTTYYADVTSSTGCTSTPRTAVVATVILVPSAAGPIAGSVTYTPGTNGIPYSVAAIPEATSYIWTYTGTGITIHGTGTSVTLDFSSSATGGQLKVKGHNSCYDGLESSLGLSPNPKTLNITVFLEGLYNGSGGIVKVQGCDDGETSYDMFSGTISDTLTVQIAQTNDPFLILHSEHGVDINTDGTISLNTIPGTLTNSYYIIIKHRGVRLYLFQARS
jgi:glucokinase